MADLWFFREGQRLSRFSAEDGSIAYHDLSGETHYLNETMVMLIERLRDGPATVSALIAGIMQDAQHSSTVDFESQFLPVLFRLEALGLAAHASVPDESA